MVANLSMLQDGKPTRYGGYFDNPLIDSDAIFRRFPLLRPMVEIFMRTLPLSILQSLYPDHPIGLIVN